VVTATAVLLLTAAGYIAVHSKSSHVAGVDCLALLLPDDADPRQAAVQEWLDAASEEGLHIQVIHDSELLNPASSLHFAGMILPDQLHRVANDSLIGALYSYVQNGGKLMVVYDPATWDLRRAYIGSGSRLSNLVGTDYALYDRYGTDMIQYGRVWGTPATMKVLGIPPGKAMPPGPVLKETSIDGSSQQSNDQRLLLSRYQYGVLDYPCYRTEGQYKGTVLLRSENCIAAGYRTEGQGGVMFVNLPLGYLSDRTDGLLLHSFLRYFATTVLQLPYFCSVPDGVGGLVMNWHIDARSALKPITELEHAGIFSRGPFSVHFTAGPDVDAFADGKGLDISHNSEVQNWIRHISMRGDAIGDHGGWIHNYFGEHVNDENQKEYEKYLQLNSDSLQKVLGHPALEYSSPVGNHPQWISRWLEQHGYIAYYFTGDSGMGPTQVYRDGKRDGSSIWAFPVLHMGKEASLEEMNFDDVPEAPVRQWLFGVSDFVASQHAARLVYSHPLGATRFIPMLQAWFQHTDVLSRQGNFRWYTMSQLAEFLNQRKAVQWKILQNGKTFVLTASHTGTLQHMTWNFPRSRFKRPQISAGTATVRAADNLWLITAGDCKSLKITSVER
jgi:hypothetical protein